MPPGLPFDYGNDVGAGYAILLRQGTNPNAFGIGRADCKHIRFVQACGAVCRSLNMMESVSGNWLKPEVLPCAPSHYHADVCSSYTELYCEFPLLSAIPISSVNLLDLIFRELCANCLYTSRGSSFCRHIQHVVRMCPKEKMIGSHARRVIAPMQHKHTGWDSAVCHYPGEPMSSEVISSQASLNCVSTIPLWQEARGPKPASICLSNSRPKAGCSSRIYLDHCYNVAPMAGVGNAD